MSGKSFLEGRRRRPTVRCQIYAAFPIVFLPAGFVLLQHSFRVPPPSPIPTFLLYDPTHA